MMARRIPILIVVDMISMFSKSTKHHWKRQKNVSTRTTPKSSAFNKKHNNIFFWNFYNTSSSFLPQDHGYKQDIHGYSLDPAGLGQGPINYVGTRSSRNQDSMNQCGQCGLWGSPCLLEIVGRRSRLVSLLNFSSMTTSD
jgi:hypothetical protein